jgi:hypothetical protein
VRDGAVLVVDNEAEMCSPTSETAEALISALRRRDPGEEAGRFHAQAVLYSLAIEKS